MDKIDRLGQMTGALRRRVQDLRKNQPSNSVSSSDAREVQGGSGGLDSLRDRIRERVQALPPDTPDREVRAARIFVESVLAWELGEELLDDSEFARLVEQVGEQMADDEGLHTQMRTLLGQFAG